MKLKIGDNVRFTASVIKRCGHDKSMADSRGIVLEIIANGAIARVDMLGTWDAEDGRRIRAIPIANLERVATNY